MREIANQELTLADIPGPDAERAAISEFALTFNGRDKGDKSNRHVMGLTPSGVSTCRT